MKRTLSIFVKDAPVTLVFVADLAKTGGNNDGSRNFAYADAGCISQNVLAQSVGYPKSTK